MDFKSGTRLTTMGSEDMINPDERLSSVAGKNNQITYIDHHKSIKNSLVNISRTDFSINKK